jgi:hypothetical protein
LDQKSFHQTYRHLAPSNKLIPEASFDRGARHHHPAESWRTSVDSVPTSRNGAIPGWLASLVNPVASSGCRAPALANNRSWCLLTGFEVSLRVRVRFQFVMSRPKESAKQSRNTSPLSFASRRRASNLRLSCLKCRSLIHRQANESRT